MGNKVSALVVKKNLKRLTFLIVNILFLFISSPTLALSPAQKNAFDSGVYYFNTEDTSCSTGTSTIPAGILPAFIPEPYNGAFTQGANKNNVAPALVAALFSEENALGGDTHGPSTSNLPSAWANFIKGHPNPNSGWKTSSANAQGPFQFLPGTWTGLGFNFNDINDLAIAADAAAKYAQSAGATVDKPETSWVSFLNSYGSAGAVPWYANAVIKYYDYYNSQPGTTGGGGATTVTTTSATCGTTCSDQSTTPAGGGKTIVLDPGHSGTDIHDNDPQTGLYDHDYPNAPEITEVFDVAKKVETKLKADGYNVILTKPSINDSVSLRNRANIANQNNAALAVSIHDDHGQANGTFEQIYAQQVGGYRQVENGDPVRKGQKVAFSDAAVATQSQQYATIFQQERQKAQGGNPTVTTNSFDNRAGIEPGNIPMVELFSKVPWVYNETGAASGLSAKDEDAYAAGIINGVEKSVPISGATAANSTSSSNCTGGIAAGNIAQTAIGLSWPESHGTTPKPEYATAIQKYNKGQRADGADCGVFVGTVMHASGADPNYPGVSTVEQAKYVTTNPKYQIIYPATDTKQLIPGDILIINDGTTQNPDGTINVGQAGSGAGGHTYIYVGPQPPNGYNEASASLNDRSANLGMASFTDSNVSVGQFLIARLK